MAPQHISRTTSSERVHYTDGRVGNCRTQCEISMILEPNAGRFSKITVSSFLLRYWLVPSSGVAGIADGLIPPCCPVYCVVLFQPRLCHISLTRIFLPSVWPPSSFPWCVHILLTMCSSFILIRWPYNLNTFFCNFLVRCRSTVFISVSLKHK